jgi:hypothetical protein
VFLLIKASLICNVSRRRRRPPVRNGAGTKSCRSRGALLDVECFFKPFDRCRSQRARAFSRYRDPRARTAACLRAKLGDRCQNTDPYKRTPPDVADKGVFWWRAALAAYLHKLNAATEKEIDLERIKRDIGYEHPIIGVHVRHGDACHTTTRAGHCKGLEAYMPSIKTLAERYNTTRVYLATDDEAVVRQAKGPLAVKAGLMFVQYGFDRAGGAPVP